MPTFNLGDKVKIKPNYAYIHTTGQGEWGYITKISKNGLGRDTIYQIDFKEVTWHSKLSSNSWWIDEKYIELQDNPTKELSKIEQRIKKLWNESNYVRKYNAMLLL